jgi:tryptophan synthase beta chain
LGRGAPGILHGARTLVLQDADGQVAEAHSIAAGLDYPAVGPEHAALQAAGRASYVARTDAEAVAAFEELARTEGIIPALESAHALADALRRARGPDAPSHILVSLSGRGDKDLDTVMAWRAHGAAIEGA